MTKKKPDGKTLINYRIELQDKERELLEQAIVGQQVTSVVNSLITGITSMDIMTMYGLITIAEAFGWIDTKIPTVTDLMTNPEDSAKAAAAGAMSSWAENRRESRKEANQGPIDTALYEGYDKFWVTRLIGMILDPTGTGNEN